MGPRPFVEGLRRELGHIALIMLGNEYCAAPVLMLGPGEAAMEHRTDKYCNVERIRKSVVVYQEVIKDWCGT